MAMKLQCVELLDPISSSRTERGLKKEHAKKDKTSYYVNISKIWKKVGLGVPLHII
jgi:hypothetical protein